MAEYEADERHTVHVSDEIGVGEGSKGLDKPFAWESAEREDEELTAEEVTRLRALIATANFLAADRPDIRFGVTGISREMSRETKGDEDVVHVFADSDWMGCPRARRPRSGGLVVLSGVAMKHWSSTQASAALSSGDVEYITLARAVSEGLGVQALARGLEWELP